MGGHFRTVNQSLFVPEIMSQVARDQKSPPGARQEESDLLLPFNFQGLRGQRRGGMGAQQSQEVADQGGNADVIQYLCCREDRSGASTKDKRISISRSPHFPNDTGMRPSPVQGFNVQDPRPSTESPAVPEEVQRCLSAGGEDQPTMDVRKYFDLGMALAKMHYQDREAEIKKMNSTQLQMCSDAVDSFYDQWDNKTQSEKNVLLSSKRCTIDDENNIRFLGRSDMRMDFKTNVARVFEHAKAVKIGGRKARPSKIETASLQGTDSQKTTPTVTPRGGASIMSRTPSVGGTPTGNSSSTPSMGNTPTGRQPSPEAAASSLLLMPPRSKSSPLLLKRSTGSLKKDKAKEGSSAEMRKAEGDVAAAPGPGEAQLKRSSGSFKRSDSTKSTTISPKEASGAPGEAQLKRSSGSFKRSDSTKSTTISPKEALKRSSGSFKLGAAAPFVKTESLTGASPLNKAASSPTDKANKNVEFLP